MKKNLALKTVLLTLAVIFILAISAFGVASLFAPEVMMDYTYKIGLKEVSADYAFREYERSGDVSCLARSFLISAEMGQDKTANYRFGILYGDEAFGDFCDRQDEALGEDLLETLKSYSYRGYLCGVAASVRYRLEPPGGDYAELLRFAVDEETEKSFPKGNPSVALAVTAARAGDGDFCRLLLEKLEAGGFAENADYLSIVKILEEHS